MNNTEKKQKIEQLKKGLKIGGKVAGKVGKKILKVTAKTLIKTAKLGYKGAHKTYQEYKKLNAKNKRSLRRGALIGGGIIGLAGGAYYASNYTPDEVPQQQTSARADSIYAALTKTYHITDKESFRQLYEDALPMIHASMLPIEIYKASAYDDRGGANPNSIAVGLFWFPKNGDPKSSEWIKTRQYFKQHKNFSVSYEDALKYTDGWYRYREGGRVFNQLYKRLKGIDINIHQFVACATCTYNNEQSGFKFCDAIQKNIKNPVKCAYTLLTLDPEDRDCVDGILKRHTAEACMFLYPEYAMQVYSFKMKTVAYYNKEGKLKHKTVTSVNQIAPGECWQVRKDMEKGDTTSLNGVKNKIFKYICKGGTTIEDFISNHVKDSTEYAKMMSFNDMRIADFEKKQAEMTYGQALNEYEAGNYEKALAGFNALRENGYDGADLRCDIALTHYHLGHYQECIDECQAVLASGEEELFPRANYNAGKAYEDMGNYERAYKNYELSFLRAKEQNMNEKRLQTYQNAMRRTDSIIKRLNPQPVNPQPVKQSKVTPKNNQKQATATAKTKGKTSTKAKGNKGTAKPVRKSPRGR